jgi:hypothetical protein
VTYTSAPFISTVLVTALKCPIKLGMQRCGIVNSVEGCTCAQSMLANLAMLCTKNAAKVGVVFFPGALLSDVPRLR